MKAIGISITLYIYDFFVLVMLKILSVGHFDIYN